MLILTTFSDDEWLFDVLRAAADGYLLKDTPRADVIKAVKGIVAGNTYMDPAVAGRVLQQAMGSPAAPPTSSPNSSPHARSKCYGCWRPA